MCQSAKNIPIHLYYSSSSLIELPNNAGAYFLLLPGIFLFFFFRINYIYLNLNFVFHLRVRIISVDFIAHVFQFFNKSVICLGSTTSGIYWRLTWGDVSEEVL